MLKNQKFCFKKEDEDIYLFTLHNAPGTEITISNYGAIITSFKIKQKNNELNDIVLGFESMEDYLHPVYLQQYPYFGAACGRYANRIKNGQFQIEGTVYQLTQNMGSEQLHGGLSGFDKKVWQIVFADESSLVLKYLSKDGEEGFPGNLETSIRFSLNDTNEFSYEFTATTDKTTAVNLTHHSYFNLNNRAGSIEDHEIKIFGSHILAQDKSLVCNGELIPVENTVYDFRKFRAINKDWDRSAGYDQCFVMDQWDGTLRQVAEIRSPLSGMRLQLFSTEPAVQLYTGQGIPSINGKNGINYESFSGLCLETHKHPNAINIPHFPNTILRPGEIYSQQTVYRFFEDSEK